MASACVAWSLASALPISWDDFHGEADVGTFRNHSQETVVIAERVFDDVVNQIVGQDALPGHRGAGLAAVEADAAQLIVFVVPGQFGGNDLHRVVKI